MSACTRCSELQSAYDDFQSQSKEFEAELEHELAEATTQIGTLKTKLEKANTALSSERESNKTSIAQLHSQIAAIQTELTKSNALVDTLKSAKRALEQSQSDAETHLRRSEAALQDANEKADHHAEQVVMLRQELEDIKSERQEAEARARTELKEMKSELAIVRRTAESSHNESNATTEQATTANGDSTGDAANFQEEITLLQEEKAALQQDIEEVTTDLTKKEEEIEALTAELDVLKAQVAAGGSGPVVAPASPKAPTSLSADLATIDQLRAQLAKEQAAAAEELKHADERVADAHRETEQLLSQLDEAKKENSTLEATIATLKSSSTSSVQDLQSQLDQARKDNATLESTVTALRSEANAAKELRAQLDAVRAEKDAQAKTAHELKAQLDSIMEEKLALDSTIQSTRASIEANSSNQSSQVSETQEKLSALQTQLTEATLVLSTRTDELAAAKKDLEQSRKTAAQVVEWEKERNVGVQTKLEDASKKIEKLQTDLAQAREQLSEIKSTSASATEYAALKSEASQLRADLMAANEHAADDQQHAKERNERIAKLEGQISTAQAAEQAARKDAKLLEDKLNKRIDQLESEVVAAKTASAASTTTPAKEDDASALQQHIQELSQELSEATKDLEQAHLDVEAAQHALSQSRVEADEAAKESSATKAALELLQAQFEDAQTIQSNLQAQIETLGTELDQAQQTHATELGELAQQLNDVVERNEQLQKQVQEKPSSNAAESDDSQQEELQSLRVELQKAKTSSAASAEELKTLKSARAALEAQFTEAKSKAQQATHKLNELQQSHSQLQLQLSQASEQTKSLQIALAAANMQSEEKEREFSARRAELEEQYQAKSASLVQAHEQRSQASHQAKDAQLEVLKEQLAELAIEREDQQSKPSGEFTGANGIPSNEQSSESTAQLAALKKEKSSLLSQVADLTARVAHYSDQYLSWELEKSSLQQRIELGKQELEAQQQLQLQATNNMFLHVTPQKSNQHSANGSMDLSSSGTDFLTTPSPQPLTSPLFKDGSTSSTTFFTSSSASPSHSPRLELYSSFSSPAPLSLAATISDREKADPAHVTALQQKLRRDIEGLRTELASVEHAQAILPSVESLQSDINTSLQMMSSLQSNLSSSTDRELDLMGKLQQIKGTNIRVFCRVRPMLPHELLEPREENLLQFPSEQQISIRSDVAKRNRMKLAEVPGQKADDDDLTAAPAAYTPFNFDKVFGPQATQDEVYESVEEMVLPVLNGYRACVFAYGQTGSGKTYTIEGENFDTHPQDVGLIFRSLQTLFRGISNRGSSYKYELRLTLVELYNEQWTDLLEGATVGEAVVETDEALPADEQDESMSLASSPAPGEDDPENRAGRPGAKLTVRKGAHGMYVEGASRRVVSNVQDVLTLLKHGTQRRHIESTNLNEASSRSHLIMLVDVVGVNQATQVTSYGRLTLVDLAGSERVKNSGSSGARLAEAAAINKSLSALADVFTALTDHKAKHIPHRNSKLTFLLQDNFLGSAKTLMFVNISPAAMHAGETLCSLQFAVRARQVRLNRAQASLDGWSHKYKTMLETQSAAFATREKNYLQQIKQLKTSLKGRERSMETLQLQLRAVQEKLTEAEKRFERSEAERLRSFTQLKNPGSPSSKDRKAEMEEDRKWNQLQSEVQIAQNKALEMKQQLDKVNNEWKDKYASLERQLKDQIERMRVQRIEWISSKKIPVGYDEDAPEHPEVTALTRQVALLELEVKRLKLTRNASLKSAATAVAFAKGIVSPKAKSALKEPLSINLGSTSTTPQPTTPTVEESGTSNPLSQTGPAGSVESKQPASPQPVSRTTSVPAVSSTSSLAVPSGASSTAPVSPSKPATSMVRNLSSIPSLQSTSGSSALMAAKHAAMQAQKRAQEAQGRNVAASSSGTSSASGSRSNSLKAKRTSLLPAPKATTTAPKHTKSSSRDSLPPPAPTAAVLTTVSPPPAASVSRIGRPSFSGSSASTPVGSPPLGPASAGNDAPELPLDASGDEDDSNEPVAKRGGNIAVPLRGKGHAKNTSSGSSTTSLKASPYAATAVQLKRGSIPAPKAVVKPIKAGVKASALAAPTTGISFTGSHLPVSSGSSLTSTTESETSSGASTARSGLRQPTNLSFTSAPKK